MPDQSDKPSIQPWPMEKLRVLDICQHIHKHAEEFYQFLAEAHRDQGTIARIWGLMAVDKCNHADTFKLASRLKGEGISEIYVSTEMAEKILVKMKTVVTGVRQNPPPVLDALRFAITMEENLNHVHLRHVVRFHNEQDMVLITSPLKSSSGIVHMMTEEYVNMTLLD